MLRFRVLGPLEVEQDGRPVEVVGQRQRALLSILLMHANAVVALDTLVDDMWGEEPPRTAVTSLHNAVSQLRKALGGDVLETRPPGYVLHVEPDGLDRDVFERRLAEARDAALDSRAPILADALSLWRGSPYAELRDELFAQGDIRRLEELRLTAVEDRVDAQLAAGAHTEVVGELDGLVREHPSRERLRAQLMLALYRCGRQTDALEAYHEARRALVDELGLEPSRNLQELHGAILRQERTLDPLGAAVPPALDHTAEVMQALRGGRLVPVLGPGVSLLGQLNGDDTTPTDAQLAGRLGELFGAPEELRDNLARVSQYVALTVGVGPLYDELHAALDRDCLPGPVHRYLARLPAVLRARGLPQLLIVTTSYDETLETALREAGESFDVVSYVAHGRDRGKFMHIAADGPTRIVDEPNADAGITTDETAVILKIHGCVDRRPSREWESFVVSEDDYIDYLANVEPTSAMPVTLAAKLRRSHFLFLGYDVLDWNLRVFLRRMWGDERVTYRSWAVQPAPVELACDFWRHRDVDVLDARLDDYVGELERHTDDLARSGT